MHQQLLRGIAHGWPLGLGIDYDGVGHVEVGGFIHKDVAVPRSGFDHRDGGILGDKRDQPRAPARNDHIHQPAGLDEFLHRLPRAWIEQLDCALGYSGDSGKNLHQPLIASSRFFAAAQHDGVAGFQREHGRVDGNVRPRFIDNPHHAQRHAHLADAQAVRACPLRQSLANRIAECRNFAHTLRHLFNSRRGQQQAVAHGAFEARAFHVPPVRPKNRLGLGLNRIGDRQQQRVFVVRRKQCQFRRCVARAQQFFLRGSRVGDRRRHEPCFTYLSLTYLIPDGEENTFQPCVPWPE